MGDPRQALLAIVLCGIVAVSALTAVVVLAEPDDETYSVSLGGEMVAEAESLDALVADEPAAAARRAVPPSTGRHLVVGQLEDGRVVALSPAAVVARGQGAALPEELRVHTGASVPTGGPLYVQPHGRYLLVVATDHPDVVRLHRDWRTRDVLSIRALLPTRGMAQFGPVLPVSAQEVVVPVAFDDSLALVRIDVEAWRVTGSRVYDDRYGGFPRACAAGGSVVVSSTGWVDRFDAHTLERQASVAHEWADGLACEGDRVWLAGRPVGRILDLATLADVGEFSWDGRSGGALRVVGDQLVGVDERADVVFVCPRSGGPCRVSERVGSRPTELVVDGDHIFVAVEESSAVAVVDRSTLHVVGSVRLPSMTRGLAMYEVPRGG